MAILLALTSAFSYGISDFLGGLFSRRTSPWQIAVVAQVSSAFFAFLAGSFVASNAVGADWWWAGVAGLGNGFGTAFLYRGLSNGRMSVIAPVSAIGSALVPVAIGLALGDRPKVIVFVGILAAFPAIYLISQVVETSPTPKGGVTDGVIAGLGFGFMYTMLGQVRDEAGLMPLAVTQVVSVVAIIAVAIMLRQAWLPRSRAPLLALMLGPLGASATGFFLYATHHGLLSVVSVISSLYPAGTVILAAVILRERIHRHQGIGLVLAAIAIALVATG